MAAPVRLCSNCYEPFEEQMALEKEKSTPKEGDISICISCAQVCKFKQDLTLRNITREELLELKEKWPGEYRKIVLSASFINNRKRFN